jgi:hypothetical protein
MAVLHITYKQDLQTSKADYQAICTILKSYHYLRLSESNWAINTEEPPKSVWQRLKRNIDPNDYLVNGAPRRAAFVEFARSRGS